MNRLNIYWLLIKSINKYKIYGFLVSVKSLNQIEKNGKETKKKPQMKSPVSDQEEYD